MNVKQAAKFIGCSPQQVRALLRAGKIKGQKWLTEIGEYWTVDKASAKKYRDTPQSHGFPRGQKRVRKCICSVRSQEEVYRILEERGNENSKSR